MRKIDKSKAIFNNEMIVSRSGIYTFAHFYEHPTTNRRVVLCGMNHVGEKEYYSKIKDILNECDIVLYEPIDYIPQRNYGKITDESIYETFDFNKLLVEVLISYYLYIENSTRAIFSHEGKEFRRFYSRKNWIHADLLPDVCDNSFSEYLDKDTLVRRLKRIPYRKKIKLLKDLLHDIDLMRKGTFTARDFGRNLLMIDSHGYLLNIFIGVFSKKRDKKCFEVFDDAIDNLNPAVVGIKFGIGHIPNQRQFLERRGYQHLKSKKICCTHF